MRIIIDARSLNQGGIGTLLVSILENLDFSEHEYTLIGDESLLENYHFPCKIINNKSKPHSFFGYYNNSLAKVINDYDCYFTPNYIIPSGIKINSYCVFHDMLFTDNKTINKRFFTDFAKSHIVKKSYHVAKKIYTTSEFSKKRIEAYFGKNKEIEVIHFGLTNAFKNACDNLKDINKKKYICYVGNAKRHKNIRTLISAIEKLHYEYPIHIVMQTPNIRFLDKKEIIKISKIPNLIIKCDLSNEEYARELKEARAIIQPSSYEGGNIIIQEALYAKTPIICTDLSTFKEDFKEDEVSYFNPLDDDRLANLIAKDLPCKQISKKVLEKFDNKTLTKNIVSKFDKEIIKSNVRRNFIFNVIYQMLVVLTPLFTAPYVSRVLGVSNIGQFSFAYTLAYYFIIFGYLGFQQYAQRAIAEKQKDKEEQTIVFWQIVIARLIPVAISLIILYSLYFAGIFKEYSSLVLIFSILVAGTAFDINFYFHGKENFFIVMIINLIIRFGFLASIFLLIKSRSDLGLYTLLYSLMVVGSYLSTWLALPLNLRKVKLKTLDLKKHLKSSLSLFLPVAAVSIYAILDKTLIGILVHGETIQKVGYITIRVKIADLQNGYYFQAERIIKALLSIILAFGTVMTTRNSIEYESKHLGSIKKNVYRSFRFVFALGVPLMFGTIAVAHPFVPLFYGEGYEYTSNLIMAYSPVIILIGCSNVIGLQYLLPTKRDNKYSIAVLIGFALNLIFNVILIPHMGSMGAIVGTILSEFFIAFIEYLFIRKEISLKLIFLNIYKYVIAGTIMLVACRAFYHYVLVSTSFTKNFGDILLIILLGVIVYYSSLLILRDKYFFYYTKILFEKIKSLFIRLRGRQLNQSKTANELLSLSSKTLGVKGKYTPIIKKDEKEDE